MDTKTHIRKMQDNNYLGEWDLPLENEGLFIATITKIEIGQVIGSGNKKSEKPLVFFKEFKKPLVLNATNRKAITSAIQSPYIEDWIGKKIKLYRIKNLKAFGETLDAIRVKNEPVTIELPIMDKNHKKFESAITAIINGTATITEIEKKYIISEEFINEIQNRTVQNQMQSDRQDHDQPEKQG